MYLFLNAVSTQGYIGIFSQERVCIAEEYFSIAGHESSKVLGVIDAFLSKHSFHYTDLTHIMSVVGPGSFTGIRTVTLVVNSLAYVYPNIFLTPLHFFDLYEGYPIVKKSSRRDLFVKWNNSAIIEVCSNADFENTYNGKEIFGDIDVERFEKQYICNTQVAYHTIVHNLTLTGVKQIAPLYIKKPNIS